MVQVERGGEMGAGERRVSDLVRTGYGDAGPVPLVGCFWRAGDGCWGLRGGFEGRRATDDAAIDEFDGRRGCLNERGDLTGAAWGDGVQV